MFAHQKIPMYWNKPHYWEKMCVIHKPDKLIPSISKRHLQINNTHKLAIKKIGKRLKHFTKEDI